MSDLELYNNLKLEIDELNDQINSMTSFYRKFQEGEIKKLKAMREKNKSLTKQRNDLKSENKRLRNLLIEINGITMREIYDDDL